MQHKRSRPGFPPGDSRLKRTQQDFLPATACHDGPAGLFVCLLVLSVLLHHGRGNEVHHAEHAHHHDRYQTDGEYCGIAFHKFRREHVDAGKYHGGSDDDKEEDEGNGFHTVGLFVLVCDGVIPIHMPPARPLKGA
jgi:hypothetical protein